MARLLGLDHRFGLLSGGAVAICGISAAMTLSSVMPKTRDVEQYTLLTVVMVAMFGAVAMVSYPVISDRLQLDSLEAGIFIGGSIHDVSHVVGARFVLAIVALGIKTSFKGLISIGWRPMALVLAESCFLGLLVAGWVLM
ncbi:MAG: putative sulfate exporter family transporter [Gammaproteobacteria bacterium]|nr:putative sulfate exporter family transporter [Gammaproteobacteria bacterium]